jgi:hypothetical protein
MNPEIEAFKKAMREAAMSGVGQYIEAGQHYFEVLLVKCQRTLQDAVWKESYIAECKVLASNNPTHEAGSTRSLVENTKNQGAIGRFQQFLAAASGIDPNLAASSPQWRDYLADCIAMLRYDDYRISKGVPENWLKGKFVLCEGMAGKSKGKGTPITNKKWLPAGAPSAVQVAP